MVGQDSTRLAEGIDGDPSDRWWGRSKAFRALDHRLTRVAPLPFPVLLTGETGTGKEGAARRLHERSGRPVGSFHAVNVAALPPSLAEAEWFGVERGAYTGADRSREGLFALAHGGTLFLDEIGELARELQPKLLRAIQEGRVRPVGGSAERPARPRIVAATHRDLPREVAAGRFRADLYHRLGGLIVRIPPLRERLDDLPLLADRFARDLSDRSRLPYAGWGEDALRELRSRRWPGNLRELEWTVLRAMLRADGRTIRDRHLSSADAPETPLETETSLHQPRRAAPRSGRGPDVEPVPREKTMILDALREADGVVARAARDIGWSRQKLYRRLRHFGLATRTAIGASSSAEPSAEATRWSSSSTFQ